MNYILPVNPYINQQALQNPVPHAYSPLNQQLPVHIQPTNSTQIQNVNQNMPFIIAPNPNLIVNSGNMIPQDYGNIHVLKPKMQHQTPIQGYYSQVAVQQNMSHIPSQPYEINSEYQNYTQNNFYQ
jgi:hypothetical protein